MTDIEELKQEMDAYGVAVRAGAITPQQEDEEAFRAKASLPGLSAAAKAQWEKDNGVRRPITLVHEGQTPAVPAAKPEEEQDSQD